MMIQKANLPKAMRYKLFPKVFVTDTLLDGLVVVSISGVKKTRFEHFSGRIPKFVSHLQSWGEAGTVKTNKKTTLKISDRGVTCMMVRYAIHHEGDCYEMLHPRTSTVYET
eukprot:3694382-Ditylum_brightwellii.AAC.1